MRTYKVKLNLNNKQKTRLFQNAGVSRFAYNFTLALQEENYKNGNKFLSDCEVLTKENTSSGIYVIINVLTYKVYVGSSKNVYKRLANHISSLRKNKHINKYLQSSFNKYLEDSFIGLFIEETECSKESLETAEQYWIDAFKSYDRENGYNNLQKAYSSIGHKMSENAKLKISKSLKASWDNGMRDKEKLARSMKGNTNMVGRKLTTETKCKLSKANSGVNNPFYGCKHSDEVKKKMSNNRPKRPIINLDTDETFNSLKEACQKYHISKGNLSEACSGKRLTAGGYRWDYL